MATYVLVHGAWHGGWCWERIACRLRWLGHDVHTPTLTACDNPDVGLHTHASDIVNLLVDGDLDDVVLVGHSYAGFVVREAADRVPDRVCRLVMVDAWAGADGESLADRAPDWFMTACTDVAGAQGAGWRIPPFGPEQVGVVDPEDAAWLAPKLTDQSLRTFQEPTTLTGAVDRIDCSAIVCVPGSGMPFATIAKEFDWPTSELESGHDAMVVAPKELAVLLTAH